MKTDIRNGVLFIGPTSRISEDLRGHIRDYLPELLGLVAIEDVDVACVLVRCCGS